MLFYILLTVWAVLDVDLYYISYPDEDDYFSYF